MKRKILSTLLVLVLMLSFGLVTAVPAVAATGGTVTFEFHASDLLNITPGEVGIESTDAVHSEQINARQLRDRTPALDWQYNTFSDQDSYNAYLNWRDGIGSGEGISAFNIWLVDQPIAKAWGETIVKKPGAPVIATCPEGWNIQLVEDPYSVDGFILEWYTTDPAKYLRPGEDQGVFSFTVDIYHDEDPANWDAGDPAVQVGDTCRIWFGSAVYEDTDGVHLDPPFHSGFIFDDASWGTLLPATVANSPGVFPSSDYKMGGADVGELLQFDATLDLEAKAATVNVPADYSTIQEAIVAVAAGGTVNVAAGIYHENILINKALTLTGTDGREQTIIDGIGSYIVHIQHSDVTFQGFTVKNPEYEGGADASGILIGGWNYTPIPENVKILNNTVTQVRSETGTPSMFAATGINVGTSKDVVISGNIITDIKNPGDPVGSSASDHTCGINVWGDTLTGSSRNIVISNNDISDIKYNGIILEGAIDVQIEDNDITGCESGVRVKPREGEISNVQIEENDITGCEYGISVVPEAFTLSGLTINYNDLAGNEYGVKSYGPQVDATSNWWGDASGPIHVGTNPLGTGNEVSDDVDFCPWLPVPKDETGGGTTVVVPGYGQDSQEFAGTDTIVDTTGTTEGGSGDITVTTSNYDPPADTGGTTLMTGVGKQALKYVDVKIAVGHTYVGDICITISYTDDNLTWTGVNEDDLSLYYYWDEDGAGPLAGVWVEASNCSVDTVNNTISGCIPADKFAGLPVAPGGGSTGPVQNIDTGVMYETIQAAINDAGVGHTIVVSDGIYTEDLKIENKTGLTLRSEKGKDVTTITTTAKPGIEIQGSATDFTLGDASGQGFTIDGTAGHLIVLSNNPSGVEIFHNTIDTTGTPSRGISVGVSGATDLTVINNTFITDSDGDDGALSAWDGPTANVTVSGNRFQGSGKYAIQFSGITGASKIVGNTITGYTGAGAIVITNGTGTSDLAIGDNTITSCSYGVRFEEECNYGTPGDMTTVVVAENKIKNSTTHGIKIAASTHILASNFVIVFNQISGIATSGLQNLNAELVTAKHNWWGDIAGPSIATNPYDDPFEGYPTAGVTVSTNVDYLPWLIRIELVMDYDGWNIVSFPITGEEPAEPPPQPEEIKAIYWFDSSTQNWAFPPYEPGHEPGPLDAMYVKVKAPISFMYPVSSDATMPSQKAMEVGWNFIGLAELYKMKASEALLDAYWGTGVATDLTGYTKVISPSLNGESWTFLRPGVPKGSSPYMLPLKGYWVLMVNNGVLGGFTNTPIVEEEGGEG